MQAVQSHVIANLNGDLSVEALATVAGISQRSFARHFRIWAEVTRKEFVERARVDAARQLLESTSMPMKTVAWNCGFSSAERMRLVFERRFSTSPAAYRAQFAATM